MQYRGLTLDPFQSDAIRALEEGRTVLVAAPTGTGKTVVADWLVERTLAAGRHVVYTAPIKALSNQKFRDYCKLLGEDRVGLVTGDLVIRREAPCRVMTTEILRNMLLGGEELSDLDAVVVDEVHFLDDEERGTVWEEVLIYLPQRVQVLGLSATLANLSEFAAWIESVRARPVCVIEEQRRAVPLSYVVACRESGLVGPADMDRFSREWHRKHGAATSRSFQTTRRRGPPPKGGRAGREGPPTRHHDVFDLLAPEHLPYLYFVFSRRDAEALARSLAVHLSKKGVAGKGTATLLDQREHDEVVARIQAFFAETGAENALDRELADLLRRGIAFHHAGAHVMLKALVEELYERRLIKVLYCTGTFALGVNMPARAAAFDQLSRYDRRGFIPLPTREFMQMAGRAGRRGMDESGLVVVRTDVDAWERIAPQLHQYLTGKYEPVRSRFALSFNSVVNLLARHPPDRIRALVERSFLSFHRSREADRVHEEAAALEARLGLAGWKEGTPPWPAVRSDVRRLRKLHQRVLDGSDRTWEEFQERVELLKQWGYLDSDGAFLAGARVLQFIQIQEVLLTELFLSGEFEPLPMPTLFGVMCGLCTDLPRGAEVLVPKDARKLAHRIEQVRRSELVQQAARLTRAESVWDPQLIEPGRMWAEGKSLGEVLAVVRSATDVSGDLVGAFRRGKDLAGQLMAVWKDDPGRQERLRELIRKVSRDEVEVVD